MKSLMSAGFLLIKPSPRPNWEGKSLLPEQIVSSSACLCPSFPEPYAISWSSGSEDDQKRRFKKLGLPVERQKEAIDWSTEQFGQVFGWPNVFYRLEDAVAARNRFFPLADLRVIGLGLPMEHAARLIDYATPPPQQAGYAPDGASGYYEMAQRSQALPDGGNQLGYELANVDLGMLAHSWLCNHLEEHCANTLGIFPAANGLLPDLASAKQCLAEITKEEVGAEPGLWLPWALVEY
jgi:hypothetical protein